MRPELKPLCAVLLALILMPVYLTAQDAPQEEAPQEAAAPQEQVEETGPTGFLQINWSSTPLGTVMSGAVDLGYDLTTHWGGDAGIPLFVVRSPFSLVTNKDWRWATLIGDPYVDIRYKAERGSVKFNSILTGTIPASSIPRIYTTGRFGGDLSNHLELDSKWIAPLVNFGIANGTVNRFILPRPYSINRPYQTFGFMSDFEGGTNFKVWHGYKLGGSFYALVPIGPQKIYSRLVAPDSLIAGDGAHNRFFDSAFETIGPSKIARDNGYSGWLEITTFKNVTAQIGFTHSVHYRYDAATFMLKFDGTSSLRGLVK